MKVLFIASLLLFQACGQGVGVQPVYYGFWDCSQFATSSQQAACAKTMGNAKGQEGPFARLVDCQAWSINVNTLFPLEAGFINQMSLDCSIN